MDRMTPFSALNPRLRGLSSDKKPQWKKYGLAIILTALALGLRLGFDPLLGQLTFITFFPAIMLTGWYGGLGPGLLCTFLCAVSAHYFIQYPRFSFHFDSLQLIRLFLFVAFGALMSVLCETLHKTIRYLQKAEEWFRITLSSIGDAAIATDIDGKIIFMNSVAEGLTGWKHLEAEGKNISEIFEIVNEFTRKSVENPIEKVLNEGRIIGLANHTVLISKGRKEYPIEDSAAPIRDSFGKLLGVIMVFHDVTERRLIESKLKNEHEWLTTTLSSIGDAVIATNKAGEVEFLNPIAESLCGWTSEEAKGKPLEKVFRIINEQTREAVDNPVSKVLKENRVIGLANHTTLISKNGKEIPIEDSAAPIRSTNNEILGAVMVFHDVTEKRSAERLLKKAHDELEIRVQERTQELSQSNNELTRSNEELATFAYVASHDLQEPIRMIRSYAQLLEKSAAEKLSSEQRSYLKTMTDGVKRIQILLDDLLSYSRVRSMSLQKESVDMNEILKEVLSSLEIKIGESRAIISQDSLPVISAARSQMAQLFQNLISNSLKFQSQGQIPKLHISVHANEKDFTFCVTDNGIGIDSVYFEKIFIIFQRLNSRDSFPGTGIGLAICKKIVERHDGKIWVESNQGKGSAFFFSLPKV
jgi:PAS domain S-box-containing protein